ncbi:hypothetical protein [Hymenobacter lucidus]|uniref:Carboxypeptidase regulatory-like domain-containing protein n=1 Tax=Hymenobacter lucidus TaxID=2880930 RepID=A0ABS8AV68_9BACT|nr:hypothetical protein [Hymenobacter lucidus]MCB2408636.1 hypothetical protein [Hymenobacter lucidus]
MLKVLYIVGGLVVAALGGVVLIFSLGQSAVTYELRLTLLDATGQPLPAQPVIIWNRGYPLKETRINDAGQLTMQLSESFGAIALGPRRPDAFAVRLSFPSISPLYYWFQVQRSGPVPPYEVFNDSYSYGTNQWVGDFDAQGSTRRQTKPDQTGKVSQAVPPTGGQVLRWAGTAELRQEGKSADNRRHYVLEMTLRQSGTQTIGPR